MATNNVINVSSSGIVKYDGAGTFSAVTTTQYAPLVGASGNGIASLTPLTNGQLVIGSTGGNPVPASLTAGTGIAITPGAGSISIAATGGGVAWTVVATDTSMAVNNGYGSNKAGVVHFTLPAVAAIGSTVAIQGMQGSWTIVQGAGQSVQLGATTSTVGAGGSVASTNAGDSIYLVCLVTNLGWYATYAVGNLTIV